MWHFENKTLVIHTDNSFKVYHKWVILVISPFNADVCKSLQKTSCMKLLMYEFSKYGMAITYKTIK